MPDEIPESEVDNIIRLYSQERHRYAVVAKMTGHSKEAVKRCLLLHEVPMWESQVNVTPVYEELYDAYVTNRRPANSIALDYGVTKATVLVWLHAMGIPVRTPPNSGGVDMDVDALRQSYVYEHKGAKEIAREIGCHDTTVSKYIKKLHLDEERREHWDELIRNGVREGLSAWKIHTTYGISYSRVRRRIEALGLMTPARTSAENISRIDPSEVVTLYVDGQKSIGQIAQQMGVSSATIRNILIGEGTSMRPRYQHAAVDANLLYQRYVIDRASYAEITQEFGISPITLNRVLRANGISLHRDVSHPDQWGDAEFSDFVRRRREEEGHGLYFDDVAAYFDASVSHIRHRAHDLGLEDCFLWHQSRAEKHWADWLDANGIGYERNVRTLIPPKEIDLYIPDISLGIEINPTYTHSVDIVPFGRDAERHRITMACRYSIYVTMW